jgi:hypothetical protein
VSLVGTAVTFVKPGGRWFAHVVAEELFDADEDEQAPAVAASAPIAMEHAQDHDKPISFFIHSLKGKGGKATTSSRDGACPPVIRPRCPLRRHPNG